MYVKLHFFIGTNKKILTIFEPEVLINWVLIKIKKRKDKALKTLKI